MTVNPLAIRTPLEDLSLQCDRAVAASFGAHDGFGETWAVNFTDVTQRHRYD